MGLILIADDIAISRETLARVLRDIGHRVITAASAEEAVERVRPDRSDRSDRPDLAVLDLNMPRMTGLQAVPLLKAEFPGQLFPCLIVSGRILTAPELTQVLGVAEDFLRKPYATAEICARIEVWLRTRRLFDDQRRGRPSSPPAAPALPAVTGPPSRTSASSLPDALRLRPRGVLIERIDEEWRRSLRWNEPFALLFCEVAAAPGAGAEADLLLQQLSRTATRLLRQIDILGMVEPQRLAILLPNTPPAGALSAAERLRAEMITQVNQGACHRSTSLALGLALVPGRDICGPEDLYQAAEIALRRACEEGPFSLCLHQHQGYLLRDP